MSSPVTVTLETSTGFITSTVYGESGISFPLYSTFTLCGPISRGLQTVSNALSVVVTGSSNDFPLGFVIVTLQVGSGANLPSFLVGARTSIGRFSPTCIAVCIKN